MSTSAEITLTWLGGEDVPFRLALGQLRMLQDKCNAGPATIRDRLASGAWRVDDIRETIRLGLIGGGMTVEAASAAVKAYVDEQPLAENILTAFTVLSAAIVGVPDDPVGKPDAEETPAQAMTA